MERDVIKYKSRGKTELIISDRLKDHCLLAIIVIDCARVLRLF